MSIQQQWVQQVPDTAAASGDDVVQATTIDDFGNLYAAGYRTTNNNIKRAWIGKYDATSGTFTHLRLLKKSGKNVEASAIALGSNNRLYVAGTFADGFDNESFTNSEQANVFDQDGSRYPSITLKATVPPELVKRYVWIAEYDLEKTVDSPITTENKFKVIQQNWMFVFNYYGDRRVKDIVTDGSNVYLAGSTDALKTEIISWPQIQNGPRTAWVAKVNSKKLDWLDEPYGAPKANEDSEGLRITLNRDGSLEVFGCRESGNNQLVWVAQYKSTYSTSNSSDKTLSNEKAKLPLTDIDTITDIVTDGLSVYVAGKTTKATLAGLPAANAQRSPWPYATGFDPKGKQLWAKRINHTLGANGPSLALYGDDLYITGENPPASPAWVANYDTSTGIQRWLKDITDAAGTPLNGDAYAIAASGFGVYVAGCVSDKKKGLVARLGDTFNTILSYILTASPDLTTVNGAASQSSANLKTIRDFIDKSSGVPSGQS